MSNTADLRVFLDITRTPQGEIHYTLYHGQRAVTAQSVAELRHTVLALLESPERVFLRKRPQAPTYSTAAEIIRASGGVSPVPIKHIPPVRKRKLTEAETVELLANLNLDIEAL